MKLTRSEYLPLCCTLSIETHESHYNIVTYNGCVKFKFDDIKLNTKK